MTTFSITYSISLVLSLEESTQSDMKSNMTELISRRHRILVYLMIRNIIEVSLYNNRQILDKVTY